MLQHSVGTVVLIVLQCGLGVAFWLLAFRFIAGPDPFGFRIVSLNLTVAAKPPALAWAYTSVACSGASWAAAAGLAFRKRWAAWCAVLVSVPVALFALFWVFSAAVYGLHFVVAALLSPFFLVQFWTFRAARRNQAREYAAA